MLELTEAKVIVPMAGLALAWLELACGRAQMAAVVVVVVAVHDH